MALQTFTWGPYHPPPDPEKAKRAYLKNYLFGLSLALDHCQCPECKSEEERMAREGGCGIFHMSPHRGDPRYGEGAPDAPES